MKSAFLPFDERLAIIEDVVKPGYAALGATPGDTSRVATRAAVRTTNIRLSVSRSMPTLTTRLNRPWVRASVSATVLATPVPAGEPQRRDQVGQSERDEQPADEELAGVVGPAQVEEVAADAAEEGEDEEQADGDPEGGRPASGGAGGRCHASTLGSSERPGIGRTARPGQTIG